ncbi:MAG: amidohydrolase family protein, partial [Caldisphaera sp.]
PIPGAFYTLTDRLKEMRQEGVDMEVLSVYPYTFFYSLEIEEAKTFCRYQNDAISNVVKQYPKHFRGLATVPLQDINEAIIEMERAIKQLHMIGVEIGSNINGKNLDDESLRPFFEKAEKLGALILVHPINVIGIERMSKYYLNILVGNPSDTTLAIASMIFGGVFDEFPNLKICFAHGGGFAPYQVGRFDQGYLVRPEPKKNIQKPPSAYLQKILFDTIVYDEMALKYLIDKVGASNLLLGTDSPLDMHDHALVSKIRNLPLTNSAKEQILGKNIQRILPKNF